MLEKGKRLLEEGDEAEPGVGGVELLPQPHHEDLWLHLAIDQKLRKKKLIKGRRDR